MQRVHQANQAPGSPRRASDTLKPSGANVVARVGISCWPLCCRLPLYRSVRMRTSVLRTVLSLVMLSSAFDEKI
jgi:hypothetical protein